MNEALKERTKKLENDILESILIYQSDTGVNISNVSLIEVDSNLYVGIKKLIKIKVSLELY